MKIGILLADELREELREAYHNYAGMFLKLLDGFGFTYQVYDIRNNEFPATPGECDGYLITGSRHGVYDNLPWLPPLFDCIRQLRDARAPLLGICFGHQAVAQALGGNVKKSEKGWGMGRHEWRITAQTKWMRGANENLSLMCMHQDQVTELPPNARVLLTSNFCQYAAYAIGDHIFCIQGHPEFEADFMDVLLNYRKEDAPAEAVAAARESLSQSTDSPQCAKWIADFFIHSNSNA